MSQNKDFKCERCLMTFSSKQRYNSHIMRINKCDVSPNGNDIEFENPRFTKHDHKSVILMCKYCKKTFGKNFFLDRHLESTNSRCYIERNIINENRPTIVNNTILNNTIKNSIINKVTPVTLLKKETDSAKYVTKEMISRIFEHKTLTRFCLDLMQVINFNIKVEKKFNWFMYPKILNLNIFSKTKN